MRKERKKDRFVTYHNRKQSSYSAVFRQERLTNNLTLPQNFTMLMMLRSLNIDPDILGYDATEDKWQDT